MSVSYVGVCQLGRRLSAVTVSWVYGCQYAGACLSFGVRVRNVTLGFDHKRAVGSHKNVAEFVT